MILGKHDAMMYHIVKIGVHSSGSDRLISWRLQFSAYVAGVDNLANHLESVLSYSEKSQSVVHLLG